MPAKPKAKSTSSAKASPQKNTPSKKNTQTTNEPEQILDDTTAVIEPPLALNDKPAADIDAMPANMNETSLVEHDAPLVEHDAPLKLVDNETRQTILNVDDEGDEPDDDDTELDVAHSDKTAITTQGEPVPTTQTELLASMMQQLKQLRSEMATNAEQVTGLQEQLAARDLQPRRGRAYALRPWMSDKIILALPTVSTAPILVLNGPKDAISVRWKNKRNELMDKWAELKMYNPLMTWGTCSTDDDKIQMVCHVHCVRHFTDMSNVCVCVWCSCVCMQCSASKQAVNWGGHVLSST